MLSTAKPSNMPVSTWIERILRINSYIPIMGGKECPKIPESDLCDLVILPNIPHEWKKFLIVTGFAMASDIDTMALALSRIENSGAKFLKPTPNHQNNNRNNRNNSNGRNNQNRNNNENGFNNECGIHGGHEWKDCTGNPNNKSKSEERKQIGTTGGNTRSGQSKKNNSGKEQNEESNSIDEIGEDSSDNESIAEEEFYSIEKLTEKTSRASKKHVGAKVIHKKKKAEY